MMYRYVAAGHCVDNVPPFKPWHHRFNRLNMMPIRRTPRTPETKTRCNKDMNIQRLLNSTSTNQPLPPPSKDIRPQAYIKDIKILHLLNRTIRMQHINDLLRLPRTLRLLPINKPFAANLHEDIILSRSSAVHPSIVMVLRVQKMGNREYTP